MMQTLTVQEVETRFKETLASAKDSPIEITENGEVVAVLVSNAEFLATEALKDAYVEAKIAKGLKDVAEGKVKSVDEVFDRILGRN